MLGADQCGDAGDVRSGEGVASGADRLTFEPRHFDIDAAREELNRGFRVVVEPPRIGGEIARDAGDRRVQGRETRSHHVVGGSDHERVAEVGLVAQLVERERPIALRRSEREIDDVEAGVDRPRQPAKERGRLPREPRSEHAHAREARLGREGVDDPRTRCAVTEHVVVGSGRDDRCFVLGEGDHHAVAAIDRTADQRVIGVDAAVDHRDPYALAGGAAPRPAR